MREVISPNVRATQAALKGRERYEQPRDKLRILFFLIPFLLHYDDNVCLCK